MNKPVGFIGLGNMGSGMATNLAKAEYDLLVFDTDHEKLGSTKFEVATSPKEIAKKCQTVILCLPNPEVSQIGRAHV